MQGGHNAALQPMLAPADRMQVHASQQKQQNFQVQLAAPPGLANWAASPHKKGCAHLNDSWEGGGGEPPPCPTSSTTT